MESYQNLVFYFIYNLVRVVLTCELGAAMLNGEYKNEKFKKWFMGLFFIVNSVGFLAFNSILVNIITNLFFTYLYLCLYEGKIIKKVFICVCILGLTNIVEVIVCYTLLNIPDLSNSEFERASYIWGSLLTFVIYFTLKVIFNRSKYALLSFKHFIALLLTVVLTMVTSLYLYYKTSSLLSAVILCFLAAIVILVFYLFYEISKYYNEALNKYIIENQNKYYKNQLEIINKSDEKIRKLQHDYKNHIIALSNILAEGNVDKAAKYIENLSEDMSFDKRTVSCGNVVIDSLINYKMGLRETENIKSDIHIAIPNELFVKDYHLNIIIGNLLDNAIAAVSKADDKRLNITIKYIFDSLVIKFENTYNEEIKEVNGIPVSSKGAGRGNGLKNVIAAIKPYNGEISFDYKNGWFSANVILHKPNAAKISRG